MSYQIEIKTVLNREIHFALQQNYIPIIRSVTVCNAEQISFENLNLQISFVPEFAGNVELLIDHLPALGSVEVKPVKVNLLPDYLFGLTEKMVGFAELKLMNGDEMIGGCQEELELLAYDQWSGFSVMPEMISAYITPNHPAVTGVIANAGANLSEWIGDPSFRAYLTQNPNVVKMQMAAIYAALQKENIAYVLPPASYETKGQRIRYSDMVLQNKMGTCLDLAILYASCLEAVGLHAILCILDQHAFTGCWLEDKTFTECVQDDISALKKRIADGVNELCLVECTAFCAGKSVSFDDAVLLGAKNLNEEDKFRQAIDIERCRIGKIRPVPALVMQNGQAVMVDFGERDKAEITSAPKELISIDKPLFMEETKLKKQQMWERKLLDLSLRNTMLGFRVTKNAVQLMVSDLSILEDELSRGEGFKILPVPNDMTVQMRDNKIFEIENCRDSVTAVAEDEFKRKRIRTFLSDIELEQNMKHLLRQAKLSMEENGSNTLYMALGFLKWFETDLSQKPRYAPLILVPMEITRKVQERVYEVHMRDEEARINITLLELLRQDFSLSIGGLDPLPTDESGIDIRKVFSVIRQGVMEKKGWDVEEIAFLGLFSFSRFIMWNDIRNRAQELEKNQVVSSLIAGKAEWTSDMTEPALLDTEVKPSDTAVLLSTDSSQLAAVCASGKGQSFVLHGPPGTGKSQTITNMISNALYHGKSVLFVAEKMAALTVVQKRLEQVGLAPFCLELHSNKAQKREVLNQLEKTLEVGHIKPPEGYQERAEKLYELREHLNEVVRELHKPGPFGLSVYDAISRYESLATLDGRIQLSQDDITSYDVASYEKNTEMLRELVAASSSCSSFDLSDFSLLENREYSIEYRDKLMLELERYRVNVNTLRAEYGTLAETYCVSGKKFDTIWSFCTLVKKLMEVSCLPQGILLDQNLEMNAEQNKKTLMAGQNAFVQATALCKEFSNQILNFDAKTAKAQWSASENSGFFAKMKAQGDLLKALRAISLNPAAVTKKNIMSFYKRIEAYSIVADEYSQNSAGLVERFGALYQPSAPNFAVMLRVYDDCLTARNICSRLAKDATEKNHILQAIAQKTSDMNSFRQFEQQTLANYLNAADRVFHNEKKLISEYHIAFPKIRNEADWLDRTLQLIEYWIKEKQNLRAWCALLRHSDSCRTAGLSKAVDSFLSEKSKENELLDAYQCAVSKTYAIGRIADSPILSGFQGASFEETVSRYREVMKEFTELTRQQLLAMLSAKIPLAGAGAAGSSEIGILQRAIKSGGRMMSIRKLFDSIPNLLRQLCPCMLMSPISVAQYIDPAFPKFDLVIFDEASQLPTGEAVGAVARGKNAIIVGDPKQLPPTSFFNTVHNNEEDYEQEDMESLLDDCLALSMPQQHLRWHYRSRHESLIAFSNRKYYDNKLFTFPSPNDLVSEVKLVPVEGFYDRGGTKQNKAEAEAVIAEIVRRLSDEQLRKDSIGVVTFSSVQQNLIDDMLMEEFRKNPDLEIWNNELPEPIFIKNLENVQGDERDIILFSIGYGPDQNGKVTMNFGPLNQDGGWRRLNVAISRSRKQMIVYSVLRADQIDLSRSTSEGIEGLKGFLEFAALGKNNLAVKNGSFTKKEHLLEEVIAEKIHNLGFETKCNIGCSEYKIDIGVINPDQPESYLLGILCDGEHYSEAGTARDRNISQPDVLVGLGWKITRVWALDFIDSPEREVQKLKEAIELALDEFRNPKISAKEPLKSEKVNDLQHYERVDEEKVIDERIITYEPYSVPVVCDSDVFYDEKSRKKIVTCMSKILSKETPISKKLMEKKVMRAYGLTRSGTKVDSILKECEDALEHRETRSLGNEFMWMQEQDPRFFEVVRVPNDNPDSKRDPDEICYIEAANAVRCIVEQQFSMTKDDMIRETAKMFGFLRQSAQIEKLVDAGIQEALKREYVTMDANDRITPVHKV